MNMTSHTQLCASSSPPSSSSVTYQSGYLGNHAISQSFVDTLDATMMASSAMFKLTYTPFPFHFIGDGLKNNDISVQNQ